MIEQHAWKRVALAMFAVGWGANQFSPMLIAYRDELGMPEQTRAFLFGIYALGLIPALLAGGGASDRFGRRAIVLPAVALSPLATALLMLEHDSVAGIAVARLLAGICSGIVFGAATAWVAELSTASADGSAARRAAIALSAGFGLGPLVAGLIAEWAPHPLVDAYVPHVILGVAALAIVWPTPGPKPAVRPQRPLVSVPAVTRSRRFLTAVAPSAPWVFGAVSLSVAYLPSVIEASPSGALAFAGILTGVTLGAGVLIQPLARRLDDRRPLLAGQLGLVAAAAGALLGIVALTAEARLLLLVAGPLFGVAYGCCLVSGLRETERLSLPDERGATVSVFYALTYLGFAVPYALGAIASGGLGPRGAVAVMVAAAAVCLAVVSAAVRAPRALSVPA